MPKKPGSAKAKLDTKAAKVSIQELVEAKTSRFNKRRVFWVVLISLVLLVTSLTALKFVKRYNQAQNELKRLSNPDQAAKDQQAQLIDDIGKLVELPKDETPTIATVTDAEKLKTQPFFQEAQDGDKVVIYSQSKRAILYRPSTKKVIEVSRVNLGEGSTEGTNPTQ